MSRPASSPVQEPSHLRNFPDHAAQELRQIRPGHYWFEHRLRLILREMESALHGRSDARVLDLGCGDGTVLEELQKRWGAVGAEERIADAALARRCGLARIAVAKGPHLPFRAQFDVVGLFDVLEHVEDDVGLLRAAAQAVLPTGFVVATVPASPALWSAADRFAGHFRRYSPQQLRDLFERCGLSILALYPLFRLLWLPARVRAWRGDERPITNIIREYSVTPLLNALLSAALVVEDRLFGRSARGVGTSLMVVARKPMEAR
jgi:2-polyprenyl-3-methyl-5-hydroxy-6-metoxy-1,4-benzoquinol methylase